MDAVRVAGAKLIKLFIIEKVAIIELFIIVRIQCGISKPGFVPG